MPLVDALAREPFERRGGEARLQLDGTCLPLLPRLLVAAAGGTGGGCVSNNFRPPPPLVVGGGGAQ